MRSLIYLETPEGKIDPIGKQIAARIKRIPAEFRGPIMGILTGDHLEDKGKELSGLFDEIITIDIHPDHENNTEVLSNILADISEQNGPSLLFLGFSHQGMEVGPSVAWRAGIPMVTACVDFDINDQGATVKRLAYSGRVLITLQVNITRGAVFSIQKGSIKEPAEPVNPYTPIPLTRVPWQEKWAPQKSKTLKLIQESAAGEEDITKATILVSAGRGIGGPDNLPKVKELASLLGGTISCSRPVVDLGWLPAARQVGISGKTVSPVVYLALGISGQANHIVGMDTSKLIMAVNKDQQAPIFRVAHYGVIDNILEFIPELIRQIKEK